MGLTCKATMKNAIESQCHECMGYYRDGKQDCQNTKCSLYQWMPYRKMEPDSKWRTRYHRTVGVAERQEATPEQLARVRRMREQATQPGEGV